MRALCVSRNSLVAVVVLTLLAMALASASAMAEDAPGWETDSHSYPANLTPGKNGTVAINVNNIGARESGEGATLVDVLPAGLQGVSEDGWSCTGETPDTCTLSLAQFEPGRDQEFLLSVNVSGSLAEGKVTNTTTAFGGGAPSVTTHDALEISSSPVKFGFGHADAWFANANGTFDTQAGTHPYAFTFNFDLNTNIKSGPVEGEIRNLAVNLPAGVVGNPTAVTQCTREQFDEEVCPTGSQIGVDFAGLGGYLPLITFRFPVYNLVPPPGHPAEFGFILFGNHILLDASVRSNGDYGITEHVDNLPQREIAVNSITIWGNPADPSHDSQRTCLVNGSDVEGCASAAADTPFLTTPTACEGPQTITATTTNWSSAATSEIALQTHNENGEPQGFEGCNELNFTPSISVATDTTYADTPAGLTVEIKTPQEGLTGTEIAQNQSKVAIAAANIKDTTVTLPEGLVVNPGQAAGLTACQSAEDGVGTEGPPSCPNSSQIGTDEIETPLLSTPLKGHVYILQSEPPHLKLLVAASGSGVDLKLVGTINLDERTGRLSTTFDETPELPFTTFRLSFSGGARAALATPASCGTYTTSSDFTPWSTPFASDVFPSSSFLISAGPNGSSCAAQPFAPELTAGSTTDQAGGYTDFSLLLTRQDGQPRISTLQFKTPKGLLGMISKVPLCGEPQAADGDCPAASQIGHTTVEAGPGPYPLVVPEPGQPAAPIYLTGGYKGAPYGLSIVVPVIAGPFNLGTVIVRASIAVDPTTAQLTITTDPLPSILDGVPTDLRAINAVIDKPEFMFNPTNCEPQSFSGTATSLEGTTAAISSHFQMGSCRSLSFKPDFTASTSAHSSRGDGASLDAKILYPSTTPEANQASSQANIASVKVDLPIQMPSRLTTLQKACLAKVFEEDPAKCPKESLVGSATAVTPVLPVPLTGPAYFVSHGGEAFPSLIVVLQGYGVTVDLVGTTFIKNGITSSTFKQVPDVPVTSFELKLPQGPYSALGANLPASAKGSFCGQNLQMPTLFTGQNGAVIKQATPITVEGCSTKLSVKHTLKGKTLTLTVYAPSAGKITIAGNGIKKITKTSKAQEDVKVSLKVNRPSKVKVGFQPTKGKRQATTAVVHD